ncbi:MAG: hypothetical protein ABI207_07785 [Crocinitomicaceae bacterium]
MNKTVKKIIIWTASIIGVGVITYLCFVAYAVYVFTSGCGLDDGPFSAIKTNQIQTTEISERFNLSENGELILTNRNDSLSPILTLIENGKVKWTLDVDVRNTKGYESCKIWELSNMTVTKDTDPIKINFIGHWTYGSEGGNMEINRENGENSFCLSW